MQFVAIWEQPWDNVQNFIAKRKAWYDSVKPDTMKVLGAYSLQGPVSKGVTLFETERFRRHDPRVHAGNNSKSPRRRHRRPAVPGTSS